MSDAQLVIILIGLAINFLAFVLGIVGLAFKVGRDFASMRAEIGERLATVEAHVANIQADRGGGDGKLRRQVR